MKVHPNVDIYTVQNEITAKQSENLRKRQNTATYWKPNEYWIYCIQTYKPNGGEVSKFSLSKL